jgi:hypothetical protein
MFDEESLHTLIARASERRGIGLLKVLRESLRAAADEQFPIRTGGNLSSTWREMLRQLATIAELQRDWGSWHKPPWSDLKLLLEDRSGTTTPLRPAPARVIDQAIVAVYDEAERTSADPPNVKKVSPLVQEKLRAQGYEASLRQIQKLASQEKHKQRRRPPGKTIASEKRPRLA